MTKLRLLAVLSLFALAGCAGSCLDPSATLSDCPKWLPASWVR